MLHWNTGVAFEIGIFKECWWFWKILQFQSWKECNNQSKLHPSRRSRTVQPSHDLAQKAKSNSWISTDFIIYHQNSSEFEILGSSVLLVKKPYGLNYLVQALAQSVTNPRDTHSTFSKHKVWTQVSHSIHKSWQLQTFQRSPRHHQISLKHMTSMREMLSSIWSAWFRF